MPGVLLAIRHRRRPTLPESPVEFGLEQSSPVALVAVTDHAAERYLQRVRGALDPQAGDRRAGVARRRRGAASSRGSAARCSCATWSAPTLVYVCMEDKPRGELIVVTLWEEGEDAEVPKRFTDVLRGRR